MYLKRMIYENVGPIHKADIETRFNNDGSPVPLIFVGKNGSGKSILLSHITDALYEIAAKEYKNVVINESNGSSKYYKIISPKQISIGETHLVSYLSFEENNKPLRYAFKCGQISANEFFSHYGLDGKAFNWADDENYKNVEADKKSVIDAFGNSIVAFFAPSRYDKPSWLQEEYYKIEHGVSFSHVSGFLNQLRNPISANCDSDTTLNWVFDILADSKAEIGFDKETGKTTIVQPPISDLFLLSIAKENIESILSAILGEPIRISMGYRSSGATRLNIFSVEKKRVICPSLDSLSTGELALFNLFSSLIRYADSEDINRSIKIGDIRGIVVIDEIDLHLHSSLQHEVLPRLIKLFPKIQFIVTTHSPLFLLGLKKAFGEDCIDIYEMPNATKITTEGFSEFENAYNYYSDTIKHSDEIKAAINSRTEKPLVVTEGHTDWKHLKAALKNLKGDRRCSDWIKKLDFEFLEYEPVTDNQVDDGKLYIQMSSSELCSACESFSKFPNSRKIIFIADNDQPRTTKKLNIEPYKKWGNNVFSFCLPVPQFRQNNPEICIELLYPDEQIKRTVVGLDGKKRRIFLGNEFDESGHLAIGNDLFFCQAMLHNNESKTVVLDGSSDKKVIIVGDTKTNYALSKTSFADMVLNNKAPFEKMDYSGFIPVFERIRDIINNE